MLRSLPHLDCITARVFCGIGEPSFSVFLRFALNDSRSVFVFQSEIASRLVTVTGTFILKVAEDHCVSVYVVNVHSPLDWV